MKKTELIERQKEEAVKRLESLTKRYKLDKKILANFSDDKLYYTRDYGIGAFSIMYPLSSNSKIIKIVKEFEIEYNALVYYCILTGQFLSLLYVSKREDEWDYEREMYENYITAYVHNFQIKEYSEFGDIIIENLGGVLTRIG